VALPARIRGRNRESSSASHGSHLVLLSSVRVLLKKIIRRSPIHSGQPDSFRACIWEVKLLLLLIVKCNKLEFNFSRVVIFDFKRVNILKSC
jgi:hypothetical protein